jgi:hypothetical protein
VIVALLLTAVDNMASYLLNFCGRFFCPKNICGMSRITSQHFFAVGGQLRKNLYIASNIGHADKSNSDILNIDGHAIIVVLILTSTHCSVSCGVALIPGNDCFFMLWFVGLHPKFVNVMRNYSLRLEVQVGSVPSPFC